MPLTNGTDLISKYFALVAVAFLGGHLSVAYGSPMRAVDCRCARGDHAGNRRHGPAWDPSGDRSPESVPAAPGLRCTLSVRLNTWLVLAYVAYIVAPLIRPAYKDSRKNPLRAGRLASGLIAGGLRCL